MEVTSAIKFRGQHSINTSGARKGPKEHSLRLMVLISRDDENGQVEKLKL